jgi:hypothetical protein
MAEKITTDENGEAMTASGMLLTDLAPNASYEVEVGVALTAPLPEPVPIELLTRAHDSPVDAWMPADST